MEAQNDLSKRLFYFAIRVIKFIRSFPEDPEYKVIKYQLIKSSTSSGANYEEAQAAISKADFHNKIRISLKEMVESNYWLRITKEIANLKIDQDELRWLINESEELGKILGSIASKTRK